MVIDKLKSILVVAITQIVAYVFLFLIAPSVDDFLFSIAQIEIELGYLVFICTVIIYGVSFVKFPTNLLWWLLGIPIMWGLIMLYYPRGVYRISGYGEKLGPILDFPAEIDALIFAISLFFLQCAIKLALFIGRSIRKKIYPM